MYRLPNSEISMFLASYSSILCAMKKDSPKGLIIGLDHNMDFLKAQQHHLTNEFIQLNLDFGMVPTITHPTRITNCTATLIDNIIVSQSFCGGYIGSIIINDISDHINISSYKEYNKTLRKVIRVAKGNYFHEKCDSYKTHTKTLWGLINEISGKTRDRSSLIEYLKIENVNEYSAKKISNSFAKHFAQVGKKFASRIPNLNKSIREYLKCLQSNSSSIYLHPNCPTEI